jgi:hypothetical protein
VRQQDTHRRRAVEAIVITYFMDSNQTRIIELLREVHLIAFKEIERLNLRIAELESRDRSPIEKKSDKPPTVTNPQAAPSPIPKSPELEFMNDKQLSAYINISVSTVRRWRLIAEGIKFREDRRSGSIRRADVEDMRQLAADQYHQVRFRVITHSIVKIPAVPVCVDNDFTTVG